MSAPARRPWRAVFAGADLANDDETTIEARPHLDELAIAYRLRRDELDAAVARATAATDAEEHARKQFEEAEAAFRAAVERVLS